MPHRSPLAYRAGMEGSPREYVGVAGGAPGALPHVSAQPCMWNSPRLMDQTALSPMLQQPLSQPSRPELLDLVRGPSTEPQHSQRDSYEFIQNRRAGSVYSTTTLHDLASAQSHELQHASARQSEESSFRSSGDQPAQWQSNEMAHALPLDPQPPHEMVRSMSKGQLARQYAGWQSTWHPHADADTLKLQRK